MLDRNKKFHVLFNSGEQGVYEDINDLLDAIKCHNSCIHNSYDTLKEANLRISQFNDDFDNQKSYNSLAYKYMYHSLEYEMLINDIKTKLQSELDFDIFSFTHRFNIKNVFKLENMFQSNEDNLYSKINPSNFSYFDNGVLVSKNEDFSYRTFYSYDTDYKSVILLACFLNGERFKKLDIMCEMSFLEDIKYYVYLMRDGGRCKIGFSKNPENRLKQIRVQSCYTNLLCKIEVIGNTANAARYYERKIHERFAHLRLEGEWFEWDKSIHEYFKRKLR